MFKYSALLASLLGLFTALPAQAAVVTLSGSTVDYTFNDSLLGLFGTPSITGNTLYFTPTTFSAQSSNGMGFTLTNSTLNIQVSAKPGYVFNGVGLKEHGDYLLLGGKTHVYVTGQLRVFSQSHPLAYLTDSITPTSPMNIKGYPTHNWNAVAGINLTEYPSYFSNSPINVTIENLLTANTLKDGTLAFIEKKFVGLDVVTAPVPEVNDWLLMLVGLGLVGLQMRRRTRADGGKHVQPGA